MKITKYDIVYFLGAGGIGMSALARWFNSQEKQVLGYDRTATSLTDELVKEGIDIHFDDAISNIPQVVVENKESTLVVYTPAIPAGHQEFNYLQKEGYKIVKRSEVLGLISKDFFTIAVAGTHGKTTTTSMVAHILKHSGYDCMAFLGGIATNFNSNLVLPEKGNTKAVMVVEADEFDRSFLRLFPNMAIVTSADADHLDIYETKSQLTDSFKDFVRQIEADGELFIQERIASEFKDVASMKNFSYGINMGDFSAQDIRVSGGAFTFDLNHSVGLIKDIQLFMPGFHNVENAVAAASVALRLGIAPNKVKAALDTYRGVKRRFEYIIQSEEVTFIDDYAHHPVEIKALLKSARALFPNKKITVVFQPHLYSRTRDFADGFAESLSLADEVMLLDIYPARELPIVGVDTGLILKDVKTNKSLVAKEDLIAMLKKMKPEVVITVGAGDIDKLVEPIKKMLLSK